MKKLGILVTGTDRGIGRQLVSMIAKKNQDVEVIATVFKDVEGAQKQWNKLLDRNKITCYLLDITKQQSIKQFASSLKKKQLKFSAIINDAAFGADYGPELPTPEIATKTLKTNVLGTINFTNAVLGSLDQHGRIINVCSHQAALQNQPPQGRKLLEDPQLTVAKLNSYIQEYIKGCTDKKLTRWFHASYGTSKAMIVAWSRFILQKQLKQGQSVICMSPGVCFSEMKPKNPKYQPSEGAAFIYNLLTIKPNKNSNFQTCG